MKNFNKKVILIIAFILFLSVSQVHAVSYAVGTQFKVCATKNCSSTNLNDRAQSDSNFYYQYNTRSDYIMSVSNSHWTEYLADPNGKILSDLICLDPILVTPSQVKITKYINPYNKTNNNDIGLDAALMHILTSNESAIIKETTTRIILAAWGQQNTSVNTVYTTYPCQAWGYLNAFSKTANSWLQGTNYTNWQKSVGKNASISYKTGMCYPNTNATETFPQVRISNYQFNGTKAENGSVSGVTTSSDLNRVYNLFSSALSASAKAIDSKNNMVSQEKIFSVKSTGETEVVYENNSYYLEKSIDLTINSTGLKNGFLRIKSVTTSNNSVVVSSNVTFGQDNRATNLINRNSITLNFKAKEDSIKDEKLKYNIIFEYCPEASCKIGYYFEATSGANSFQRLIGLDESGASNSIEGKISFTTDFKRPCDTSINISSACDKGTKGTIETKKDSSGNDDAKCFTDNTDDVGNTYKLDNSKYLFGDSNCENIYCKEEYKIDFDPYGVVKEQNKEFARVTSGRYFQINATITDNITCYIETTTSACKNVAKNLVRNIMLEKYPKFSFLTKTENFSELQYKYDDYYFGQLSKQKDYVDMKKSTPTIDSLNIWYCPSMSQSSDYRNCAVNPKKISSNHIDTIFYWNLIKNNIGNQDGRLKITLTASAKYSTNTQYQNIYTSGSIKNSTTNLKNSSDVKGLPVKIDTEKGLYQYKFRLTNLGDYYDNQGNPGRLIGNKNSVLNKLQSQGKVKFNGEYVCYYFVNCPTCEADCSKDTCEWNNCPTCNSDCINCLYDESKLKLNFRQISSNDVNPNDRELGYNWNVGLPTYFVNTEFNYTNLKALTTVTEIEKSGEQAEQTPILTIDMTPELAQELRKYNKNKSYSNATMECYDIVKDSKTYKNLACYSTVLDDLKSKYSNQVNFINTRTDTNKRNTQTISNSGYWTLFTSANQIKAGTNYKGKYYTTTTFDFDDSNHIGGPSWK